MRKAFSIPEKSIDLAEFCGIMLGDGGISKYQIAISLHSSNDKEYSVFVRNLIKKLFGISPGQYERNTSQVIDLVISRIGLVEFLTKECGLKLGNKIAQKADIPEWIKEDAALRIACMRGLVDTDGSIFTHRYISKKKEYSYKKMSFTSCSDALLISAESILQEIGLNPRFGSNHDIRLDSKRDMTRYFDLIGSNNPKHLNRYAS